MPILTTTVGGAESNSYLTVNEADEIAAQFPWFEDWNTCTNKEENLIAAAKAMNGLPWIGDKCYPASDAGREAITWGVYPQPLEQITNPQAPFYLVNRGPATAVGLNLTWGKLDGTAMVTSTERIDISCKNFTTADIYTPDDLVTPVATAGNGLADNISFAYAGPVGYIQFTYNPDVIAGTASFKGIFIDNVALTNVRALPDDAPQALAWPRSDAECNGETATCDYIPYIIKEIQVIIAYNFCSNPDLVPGAPDNNSNTQDGTFVKRQKIDVLEIEYEQYTANQFNYNSTGDCTDCDDPYLYTIFRWLKDMLGCWVEDSGKNNLIRLFRN